MSAYPDKQAMLTMGQSVVAMFCALNDLEEPSLKLHERAQWPFPVCAYYRASTINVCLPICAAVGTAGRQWSCPGHTVDRTPYGVLQHELGHHVDVLRSERKGRYFGDFSVKLRQRAGEAPITSYCENDAEWFAEMFRVFVTNPDLLRRLRPATHRELSAVFKPVFDDSWRDRLAGAPERTIHTIAKRLGEA